MIAVGASGMELVIENGCIPILGGVKGWVNLW